MLAALLTSVQVTVRKRFHRFTGTQVAPDQVLSSASCEKGVFGPTSATVGVALLGEVTPLF